MTILDAQLPIECDQCYDEIRFDMPYVYQSYDSRSGYYSDDERNIEEFLEEEEWIIEGEETGYKKHFCCEECYEEWKEVEEQNERIKHDD